MTSLKTSLQNPYAIAIGQPLFRSGPVGGKDFFMDAEGNVKKRAAKEAFLYHVKSTCVDVTQSIQAATLQLGRILSEARDRGFVVTPASTLRDDFSTTNIYRYATYNNDNDQKKVFVEKRGGNGIYYLDSDSIDRPADEDLSAPYSRALLKKHARVVLDAYEREQGVHVSNYVVHASSSAGFSKKIKLHIFWVSTELTHRQEMHARAQEQKERGNVIDPGVYSRARKIYLRDPTFTGMTDPVEERIVVVTSETDTRNDPLFLNALEPSLVEDGARQSDAREKTIRARSAKLNRQIKKGNYLRSLIGAPPMLPQAALSLERGCSRLAEASSLDHNVALYILKENIERHGWNLKELESKECFDLWMKKYLIHHNRAKSKTNPLNKSAAIADQKNAFKSTIEKVQNGTYVPFAFNADVLYRTLLEQATERIEMPFVDAEIHEADLQLTSRVLGKNQFISDVESFDEGAFKIVIGGTGTGKTFYVAHEVCEYLSHWDNNDITPNIILQVATRTLARDATENLNLALRAAGIKEAFTCYLDSNDEILDDLHQINLLVVSTQSIWRMDLGALLNLSNLFYIKEELNETTSALISNTCHDNAYKIRQTEKIIAFVTTNFLGLDASLKKSQYEQLLVDFEKEDGDLNVVKYSQNHENRRRSQKGWVFHKNYAALRTQFIDVIKESIDPETKKITKKIAANFTKANQATAFAEFLLHIGIPREQVFLFTSDAMDVDNLGFAHTNEPGVMLYSPVLAAGFDAKGIFDEHYAFATPHAYGVLSADAIEQQTGRIRHCRNERHIYSGEGSHFLTNVEAALNRIIERVGNVPDGSARFSGDAKQIRENIRIEQNAVTFANLEVVREMLTLRRTAELTNQNVIMQLASTWQEQGVPVFYEPGTWFDPEIEAGLRNALAVSAEKKAEAITNAAPMLESRARKLKNKSQKNEVTTAAATTKKSRLLETFGSNGPYFVKPDANGKIAAAQIVFIKTACAVVGDKKWLNEVEKRSLKNGTILDEGPGLFGYYKQLGSLARLAGFNMEILRKSYHSALSKDSEISDKIIENNGERKQIFDELYREKINGKFVRQNLVPALTSDELEAEPFLNVPAEPIDGSISAAALEVWGFIKSNKRMFYMLSRSIRNGPQLHYENFVKKKAAKPKSRFVPWLLLVQRSLARKLTGFSLTKVREGKRVKRRTVGWVLLMPHFVSSTHRSFRKFFKRRVKFLSRIIHDVQNSASMSGSEWIKWDDDDDDDIIPF